MFRRLQLRQAAYIVRSGGIVAYPTEAVFGIGCDPYNSVAVERILAIKGRTVTKGLILIAANIDQITPFIAKLPDNMTEQILASWPGPTTWILPTHPNTPYWLTGGRTTIAVRITSHLEAAALCRICKTALVSTSANRTGASPIRSLLQMHRQFDTSVDYLLPGYCGTERRPSRIIDATSGKIVRF